MRYTQRQSFTRTFPLSFQKQFLTATAVSTSEIDMARCALIIAGHFQPGLNVNRELKHIDELATKALDWPVVDAETLVDFLAVDQRFRGNREDYYSISNSLLNHVITNRRGIPITLALVYISVVQRLSNHLPSIKAYGINFPAHFLLGVQDQKGEQLIDPFAGKIVSREACYEILANLYGQQPEHDDRYFKAADNRQLLRRILENLKGIYLKKSDSENVIACLDFQLMLYPQDSDLLKQQQQMLAHLRNDTGNNRSDRLLQ